MAYNDLKISIWVDDVMPNQFCWRACVGDYDLDSQTGDGATPEEAVEDLLAHVELEKFLTKGSNYYTQMRIFAYGKDHDS